MVFKFASFGSAGYELVHFSNNISVNNINLLAMKNYFLNKIKNTKIFNLDDETLFMEFEDRVLNG